MTIRILTTETFGKDDHGEVYMGHIFAVDYTNIKKKQWYEVSFFIEENYSKNDLVLMLNKALVKLEKQIKKYEKINR